jgi:UDP-N-acetylmuramoyl-L-alanyl-D-glutamate--2,6-diaminopimelate ligase
VFVAVRGTSSDGHAFVEQAEQAGAVAVVGDRIRLRQEARATSSGGQHGGQAALARLKVPYLRVTDARSMLGRLGANFYGQAQRSLRLVGVTGTKGKTTTAWILDSIFRAAGEVSGLFGTVHNRIGDMLIPARNTTPSSLELHRHFKALAEIGGSSAVLEVSSHGISQKRTAGTDLAAAILTNVAPEHLDYHKTFENYLQTKARLFRELPRGAVAVLPREGTDIDRLRQGVVAEIIWYGTRARDGVERVRMNQDGMTFVLAGRSYETKLWGDHNLLNVLAAISAAEGLGLGPDAIRTGVAEAEPPPGRLEPVRNPLGVRVLVDYAHTDGSLEAVLMALRSVTDGRIITVFGCGGDRDKDKRPRMGRVAEAGSDHIVVTSDNPRTEEPEAILDDIRTGLTSPEEAVFEPDRRAAIGLGIRMARERDTVLIAGKGHETYQEINEERAHFDDREVAREFLREQEALRLSWNRSN